jgi:hypothetical protein
MADPQSYADSGGYLTNTGIAGKRRLADTMLQAGLDSSPIGHWTQGLGRLAQALVGGYGGWKADEDERKGLAELGGILGGSLGGDPRTVRTNNPGAIEYGPFARSAGATGTDGRYATFADAGAGYAAMDRLLGNYGRQGRNTVASIIERWAPRAVDNNSTDRYIATVSRDVGVGPNDPIPPDLMPRVAEAMAAYEAGRPVPRPGGGGGAMPPPMRLGGPSLSDTGDVSGGAPPASSPAPAGAPPPIDFRGAGLPELAPNATLPPAPPAAPVSQRPPTAGMPPTLMDEARLAPPAGATTAGGLGAPSSLPPMSGPMPQPTGVPGVSSAGPMPAPAPAGPPAAPPPAAPAAQGSMPANDVIRRLLTSRNPMAIQFGMQLYRDLARRGPTADYDFQAVEGTLYRINKRTGQAEAVVGTGQPRPPEAVRSRAHTTVQAYNTIVPLLDQYAALIQRTGSVALPGRDRDAVEQSRRYIQLQLKELEQLGALTGPDVAYLEGLLPDPTVNMTGGGPAGLFPSFGNAWDTAGRTKAAVDQLKGFLRQRAAQAAQAAGLPQPGGGGGGGDFSIRRLD